MPDAASTTKSGQRPLGRSAQRLRSSVDEIQGGSSLQSQLDEREHQIAGMQVQLANVLNGSLQGILVRTPSRTRFANPAILAMFGYSEQEFAELDSLLALHHPDEHESIGAAMKLRRGGDKTARRFEARCVRKDGTVFWVEEMATSVTWFGEPGVQIAMIDITERKNAELRLLDSERINRETFEHAPVAMIRTSRTGGIVDANVAFANLLGYEKSDYVGKNPRDFSFDAEMNEICPLFEEVWSGARERMNVEHRMIRKDGSIIWVKATFCTTPGENRDQVLGLSEFQDVTSRREAEIALKNREKLYRDLVDHSLQGIMIATFDGTPLFINQIFADMFGRRPAEIVAMKCGTSLYHPEDRKKILTLDSRDSNADPAARRYEIRGLRSDGSIFWIEQLTNAIEWHGQKAIQIVGVDITDRKLTERALAARERKYRMTFEHAPVAMLRTGRDRGIIEANEAFARLLGYDCNEFIGKRGRHFMRPEQIELVGPALDSVWNRETEVVHLEHPMIRKDKTEIWVTSASSLIPTDDGTDFHMLTEFQDVTEAHTARQALKERETLYRNLVDQSIQGIHVLDLSGKPIFVNSAYAKMFGRTPEEILALENGAELHHPDDRKRVLNYVQGRQQGNTEVRRYEVRGIKPDGTIFWLEQISSIIDWRGQPAIQIAAIDVTERKAAERLVAESEKIYRETFKNAPVPMIRTRRNFGIVEINHAFVEMLGYGLEECRGKLTGHFVPEPDLSATYPSIRQVWHGEIERAQIEHRMIRKDGREIWVNSTFCLAPDDKAEAEYAIAQFQDITGRRNAEIAMRRSEAMYRSLVDQSIQGIHVVDLTGKPLFVNGVYAAMFGRTPGQILDLENGAELYHPDDHGRLKSNGRKRAKGDAEMHSYEIRGLKPDGTIFWLEQLSSVIEWRGEKAIQVAAINITERKQSQNLVALREKRYRQTFEDAPVAMLRLSNDRRMVEANRAFEDLSGYSKADMRRMRPSATIHRDDVEHVMRRTDWVWSGRVERIENEYRMLRKDGTEIWVLSSGSLTPSETGTANDLLVQLQDITDRKHAEEQLRCAQKSLAQSAEQYQELFDNAPVAMIAISGSGEFLQTNNAYCEMLGYTKAELSAMRPIDVVHPCYRDEIHRQTVAAVHGEMDRIHDEFQFTRKNGTTIWVLLSANVIRNEDGRTRHVLVHFQDITSRKTAEDRLLQSQKMEALGNLAGGIAHDFNNMLLPIIALTDLSKGELPAEHPVQENLENVLEAAQQARNLVSEILTFSRQGDAETSPINISRCMRESVKLLRNVLPSTIRVVEKIERSVGTINANLAQLNSVIMNLGSNAAYAMDGQIGELIVGLEAVVGDQNLVALTDGLTIDATYAHLSIRDTGCGMDKETLEKIFNPFFTTKPVGEGTGLGLAMVHGIIKRFGGAIRVDSQPGQGTTFDIYLPLKVADSETQTALENQFAA